MKKLYAFVLVPLILTSHQTAWVRLRGPETVVIHSGRLPYTMLWRPQGQRTVPRHPAESGNGRTPEDLKGLGRTSGMAKYRSGVRSMAMFPISVRRRRRTFADRALTPST